MTSGNGACRSLCPSPKHNRGQTTFYLHTLLQSSENVGLSPISFACPLFPSQSRRDASAALHAHHTHRLMSVGRQDTAKRL